jgi:hypothetical protein
MVKEECYFVESMGRINEHTPSTALFRMSSSLAHMSFSSFSNVENVPTPNMSNVDVSQLDVEKTRVVTWKLHNCMFICWGFFVVRDGLPMDLVKSQVLQCISCRSEQTFNNVLIQRSILCKGLIKYNKINGITPIIIHVQIAHLKLFVKKK